MKVNLAKTPAIVKNPRKVTKICNERGCDIKFTGHPVRKYCDYHRDPKRRVRSKPVYENVTNNNQIIKHGFINPHTIEMTCAHNGCTNQISLRLIPKIFIYSKYCDKHKPKHRRMES